MTHHQPVPTFFTPERRIPLGHSPAGLNTVSPTRFNKSQRLSYSPVASPLLQDRVLSTPGGQKIIQTIRVVKAQDPRIAHTAVERVNKHQHITEYQDHVHQKEYDPKEEKTLLRQLGSKVRSLIRENSRLKQHVHTEELTQLEEGDRKIKGIIQGVVRRPIPKNNPSNEIEQNPYMKDYIQRTSRRQINPPLLITQKNQRSTSPRSHSAKIILPTTPQKKEETKQPLFNQELLSLERVDQLKKYFTLYINTAIESNDQKFSAQKRYIQSLQKRIIHLQGLRKDYEHYKFEKQVKLTQSQRKRKNYSIAGPNVKGDDIPDEAPIVQQLLADHSSLKPQPAGQTYFTNRDRFREIADQQLRSEIQELRNTNINLKQLYTIVKHNYQREIEEHLRDNQAKSELIERIRQLQAQNRALKGDTRGKRASYVSSQQ